MTAAMVAGAAEVPATTVAGGPHLRTRGTSPAGKARAEGMMDSTRPARVEKRILMGCVLFVRGSGLGWMSKEVLFKNVE